MTKANQRPNLSQEQQAAIEAIRARARKERPGPDELIDRGELDELVPHAQYLEIRTLGVRMREIREGLGLSLTDVSERSGLTRAVVSRLENGWNLNPTLETLFRYAESLGADMRLTIKAPADPAAETRPPGTSRRGRAAQRQQSEGTYLVGRPSSGERKKTTKK
jgi:transcriptional regulator with XRE-family HTH domain